jgi:hypothetical protein
MRQQSASQTERAFHLYPHAPFNLLSHDFAQHFLLCKILRANSNMRLRTTGRKK